MVKIEHLGKIEGLGEIVRCYAPLDEQLKSFKEAGARLMSVEDMARMRLHGGSLEGARTCLAPIYSKNHNPVIVMDSLLIKDMNLAIQVVQSHRNNKHFVLDDKGKMYDEFHSQAEEDKTKAIIIPTRENYLIKQDSEEARAIFGKVQKDYFNKFAQNGVTFYPIDKDIIDSKEGTWVNYLWFRGPGNDSGLGGYGRFLGDGDRAFGVLKETSKAGSKNLSAVVPYSKREIANMIKIAEGVKEGSEPNLNLEKLIKILEKRITS